VSEEGSRSYHPSIRQSCPRRGIGVTIRVDGFRQSWRVSEESGVTRGGGCPRRGVGATIRVSVNPVRGVRPSGGFPPILEGDNRLTSKIGGSPPHEKHPVRTVTTGSFRDWCCAVCCMVELIVRETAIALRRCYTLMHLSG